MAAGRKEENSPRLRGRPQGTFRGRQALEKQRRWYLDDVHVLIGASGVGKPLISCTPI